MLSTAFEQLLALLVAPLPSTNEASTTVNAVVVAQSEDRVLVAFDGAALGAYERLAGRARLQITAAA